MAKKLSVPTARASALQQQDVFAQASDPLTTLGTVELDTSNLESLAAVVKEAHKAFESHLVSALQAALIAGRALIAAKELFNYDRDIGGFRGWLSEIGISKSASYRYIDLAKHDAIVSQAGTLSEAMELVAQYKAKQRGMLAEGEIQVLKKRRTTLTLEANKGAKLEQLAEAKGVEVSFLINEIVERWLSRQKLQEENN